MQFCYSPDEVMSSDFDILVVDRRQHGRLDGLQLSMHIKLQSIMCSDVFLL